MKTIEAWAVVRGSSKSIWSIESDAIRYAKKCFGTVVKLTGKVPPVKVKKTVWVNVYQTGSGEIFIGAGHWNSQSKAMEHASDEYNTYLSAQPITVEVME